MSRSHTWRSIILAAGVLLMCGCGKKEPDPKVLNKLQRIREAIASQPEVRDLIKFEAAGPEYVSLSDGDNPYAGFRVTRSQKKVNGGIRSEISIDYPFKAGDTVSYAWRLMIPEGFEDDAPDNRWWLMGQWHDQPDRTKGETWDNFPGRSPPVALAFGSLDGKQGLALSYLDQKGDRSGIIFLEQGAWTALRVEIRWARDEKGYMKVFVNGASEPAATRTGPNMHNDFQHYLKLGQYRHPDITSDNWVYIDSITIKTLEARIP